MIFGDVILRNFKRDNKYLDGQSQSSSKLIHIAVTENDHIDSIFQIQIPVTGTDCLKITDLDKESIIDELILNLKSIDLDISVSIVNIYHEHTHQVRFSVSNCSKMTFLGF